MEEDHQTRKVAHAKLLWDEAAASWSTLGQIKVSRGNRDRVREAFTSMVSNDLKRITGRWLDEDVAVLAEIALNDRDITDDQVRWARQPPARGSRAKHSTTDNLKFRKENRLAEKCQLKQWIKGRSIALKAQFCV